MVQKEGHGRMGCAPRSKESGMVGDEFLPLNLYH